MQPQQASNHQRDLVRSTRDARAKHDALSTEAATLRQQHERLTNEVRAAESALERAQTQFAEQRRAALGRGAEASPDPRPEAESRLRALRDDLDAVQRAQTAIASELASSAEATRETEREVAASAEHAALTRIAEALTELRSELATVLTARASFIDPRKGQLPSTERAGRELGLVVLPLGDGRWRLEFAAPVAAADGEAWLEELLRSGSTS